MSPAVRRAGGGRRRRPAPRARTVGRQGALTGAGPSRRPARRRGLRLPDHAALGPRPVLRPVVLGVVTGLLQVCVLGWLEPFGIPLELVVLVVACTGLLAGTVPAAAIGFGLGVAADALFAQTLGLSALALTVVGYACGSLREVRDPDSTAVPLVVGPAAVAAALVLQSLLELLLAPGVRVEGALLWQSVGAVLLALVLALPVHAAVRWWLRPMLPEEARRRRRRRAYTTGSSRLSPLSDSRPR